MGKKSVSLIPNKVTKPSGLKADGTPNIHWQRFENRIKEFNLVEIELWKEEQVLGYLLYRYKEHYKINYALSYSGSPSKCSEIYCINRMMQCVGTRQGPILKEYIDWIFDKDIIPNNKKIVSLAYFWNKKQCANFRSIYQELHKLTKDTQLPQEYIEEAEKRHISANNYADLVFIKMALDNSPEDYPDYNEFFNAIKQKGFNPVVLNDL